MDGIELTRAVHARGLKDVCVLMLTSRDEVFDFEQGFEADVDDYVSKSVSDVELLGRIHAACARYSLRKQLQETQAQLAALHRGVQR